MSHRSVMHRALAGVFTLALGVMLSALTASSATVQRVSNELAIIEVPTTTLGWQSTGINICPDSKWYLTVMGATSVAWGVGTNFWDRWTSPGGEPARLPMNAPGVLDPRAPVSSLVARIGATNLYVGGGGAIPPPYDLLPVISGALELGYNDNNTTGNVNSILVIMHCYAGDCRCGTTMIPPGEGEEWHQSMSIEKVSPNPAQSASTVSFSIPVAGPYNIGVYDVEGRRVRELLGGTLQAGIRSIRWDLKDDNGQSVTPGMYFYRLQGQSEEVARKLVVVE